MPDIKPKNKLAFGILAEGCAAKIYERRGYKIIAKNFRNSKGKQTGEIDIIAAKGTHLRFIEVKFRSSDAFGFGLEVLTAQKARRIFKTAMHFLRQFTIYHNYHKHFDFVFVYKVENKPFDKKNLRAKIYTDVIDDI